MSTQSLPNTQSLRPRPPSASHKAGTAPGIPYLTILSLPLTPTRALILYRCRRFINHLLTYLLNRFKNLLKTHLSHLTF